MPLGDMLGDLQGSVPNQDAAQARTLINEAYADVRRLGGWSWQFFETGFTVPGMLSTGTVTLQFGSPTVTGNAAAVAAWATVGEGSQYGSLITQRQFRSGGVSGAGTIYDIIAFNQGAGTLTLNRPFSDPLTSYAAPVANQEYSIYQPYIAAPVADFERWLSVYDIANSGWLMVNADRRDKRGPGSDPQRQIFSNPDRLMGIGQDTRVGSSTLGWERYELWPGPQNQYLYMAWCMRFGADLVNMSDTLPIGIPESMVKAKARARCYEQLEANKDPQNPRGAGADHRFLIGVAMAEYKRELQYARLRDRDRLDIFKSTMTRLPGGPAPTTYNNAAGGIMAQVGV
jgi:hypothetical protein